MSACQCQRSRVAVVHNGVRALSRGTFERTGDFGRGMFERTDDFGRGTFERTDNFGGWFGDFFGFVGKNLLGPLLPAGLQIGTALATQALLGKSGSAGVTGGTATGGTAAGTQSAFINEAARLEAEKAAKAEEERTKRIYAIVGGVSVVALIAVIYFRKRRR